MSYATMTLDVCRSVCAAMCTLSIAVAAAAEFYGLRRRRFARHIIRHKMRQAARAVRCRARRSGKFCGMFAVGCAMSAQSARSAPHRRVVSFENGVSICCWHRVRSICGV